jgi:hypothetical protein
VFCLSLFFLSPFGLSQVDLFCLIPFCLSQRPRAHHASKSPTQSGRTDEEEEEGGGADDDDSGAVDLGAADHQCWFVRPSLKAPTSMISVSSSSVSSIQQKMSTD